jgi:hypothetical protein
MDKKDQIKDDILNELETTFPNCSDLKSNIIIELFPTASGKYDLSYGIHNEWRIKSKERQAIVNKLSDIIKKHPEIKISTAIR